MTLYIGTWGTYVHVRDAMFEIRIKPKDQPEQKRLFSAKKVKTIVFSTQAAISTDAVKLALKHNTDIVFLENNGRPIGRFWHSKLGSTSKIRKAQLLASVGEAGVGHIKTWIGQKIDNQRTFIVGLKKHRQQHEVFLNDKIAKIEALNISVSMLEGNTIANIAETLRGLEGTAGRLYFETLSYVLTKNYQFKGRSSRPAQDQFNAFLNYAYGILYSMVEKSVMIAGLDPYLGLLHRDSYNQLSFVFDFIEPYRTFAENVVFKLFSAKKVNNFHTTEIKNGVSLNDEGKRLLVEAFNNYMEIDTIRHRGRNQTRENVILSEARQYANLLLDNGGEYSSEKTIQL